MEWWVHPNCGKPTKMYWEKSMGMPSEGAFWAPPPPGLTKTYVRIGPDVYESFTYRCDASPDCYALEYSKNADRAKAAIDGHICPAPPRRDKVSSGKTVIQKLWDELDEVIDSIKTAMRFNKPSMLEEAELDKARAKGLALALALLSTPWFRSTEDILRQANKRWLMRQGEIPWEQTPGYNFYPAAPLAFAVTAEPTPVKKRQPVSKVVKSTKGVPTPAAPPVREFTAGERNMIREAVHGATNPLTTADLAKMYGVTEERIRTIAGPKPTGDAPAMFPMGPMF
jgi:hypothetical protein